MHDGLHVGLYAKQVYKNGFNQFELRSYKLKLKIKKPDKI